MELATSSGMSLLSFREVMHRLTRCELVSHCLELGAAQRGPVKFHKLKVSNVGADAHSVAGAHIQGKVTFHFRLSLFICTKRFAFPCSVSYL
jgi:hypothetical protein